MPTNEYHFVTNWRVKGTIKEVGDILEDAGSLPRWWPSVYLEVKVVEPGDAKGIGKLVTLYTKGWLPYTLRWKFRVTESKWPHGATLEATGDFVGKGVWTLTQEGDSANVRYDWRINAEKPLLRTFSFALKPLFGKHHQWAMARGLESLELELQRRRLPPEQRSQVPQPPGAVFPHNRRGKKSL